MVYNIVLSKGKQEVKLNKVPNARVNVMKKIYYNKGYNLVSQTKLMSGRKMASKPSLLKKILPF